MIVPVYNRHCPCVRQSKPHLSLPRDICLDVAALRCLRMGTCICYGVAECYVAGRITKPIVYLILHSPSSMRMIWHPGVPSLSKRRIHVAATCSALAC